MNFYNWLPIYLLTLGKDILFSTSFLFSLRFIWVTLTAILGKEILFWEKNPQISRGYEGNRSQSEHT